MNADPLNVLSLFAGIGGLELGLERAGMRTVGQVEIDPYCRRVLEKHWPDVPRHDDVRTAADWWLSTERPTVDVICGGFPCQDISSANTAGNRKGLAGPKSGLWSAYRATVAAVRPSWVIVENSPNWRKWTQPVREDLVALGFHTVALRLPAGSFGAPHKRPRVLVVANTYGQGEPLLAIHEEVAELRPLPRRDHIPARARTMGVRDGVSNRMDRLRTLGNAVVPQVAEYVGRLIVAHHLAQRAA